METFSIESENTDPPPKKQSKQKRIPWLPVLSLLGVLLCMGASAAIVVFSNTQSVDSWAVQPAVLLAILAALSNVALGIAFSQAVVSTWWSSAANGASLEELHYIWNRGEGHTFFSALTAGPSARKVARTMLALIIIKVATGPLLQRATRQKLGETVTDETIKLNITQHLPRGWTGKTDSATTTLGSGNLRRVTRAWWRNSTIRAPGFFCDGICEGSVLGAGISYNCSSTTSQLSLLTANTSTILFEVNVTLSQNPPGVPVVILRTLHSSNVDNDCIADITIDTCEITAAIVEYPITLRKSIITPHFNISKDRVHSTYTDYGDSPTAGEGAPAGPLRGLEHFGNNLKSRAWWRTRTTWSGNGLFPRVFDSTDDDIPARCPLQWSSPTHYVLAAMRNFMFRAALDAAHDDATVPETPVRLRRTGSIVVFHSVYGYLVAASVITLFGVLFVLMRLVGWWSLRRNVSLSPLEIAKAFRAPVMERTREDNVTADKIIESVGKIQVKYVDGVMVVNDKSSSGTVEPLLTYS